MTAPVDWSQSLLMHDQYNIIQPYSHPSFPQVDSQFQSLCTQQVHITQSASSSSLSSLSSSRSVPSFETDDPGSTTAENVSGGDTQGVSFASHPVHPVEPASLIGPPALTQDADRQRRVPATRNYRRSVQSHHSKDGNGELPVTSADTTADSTMSSRLPSVCRQELSFMPYSPLGLGHGIEEEYIQHLSAADAGQICYSYRHTSLDVNMTSNAQLMTAAQYAKFNRAAQTHQDKESRSAQNIACGPGEKSEVQTSPTKKQVTSSSNLDVKTRPRVSSSSNKLTTKTSTVHAHDELVIPSPRLMLSNREHTDSEKVIRRIASFLDEQTAVKFASVNKTVYAALDHHWWQSVFTRNETEEHPIPSPWPHFSGWCDNCEKYTSLIYLQEPSKARLCPGCSVRPELQAMRLCDARKTYDLRGKAANAILSSLPCCKIRNAKTYWLPHLQWVEKQVQQGKVTTQDSPSTS